MDSLVLLSKIICRKQWPQVIQLISSYPEMAKHAIKNAVNCEIEIECLPIHLVCMCQPPLQVIAAFIAADPKSLEKADGKGRLPLHYAVINGAANQIVNFIASAAPRASYVKAADGNLPIHLACLYCGRMGLPIVRNLLWTNPESICITNGDGRLPLELIYDNLCSIDIQWEMISILKDAEKQLHRLEGDLVCDISEEEENTHKNTISIEVLSKRKKIDDKNTKFETKSCVVCMERDANMAMVPCGHVCLCTECSTKVGLEKMQWRCPECRSKIREIVRIFGRVLEES